MNRKKQTVLEKPETARVNKKYEYTVEHHGAHKEWVNNYQNYRYTRMTSIKNNTASLLEMSERCQCSQPRRRSLEGSRVRRHALHKESVLIIIKKHTMLLSCFCAAFVFLYSLHFKHV
jgi:hypothetical protein